MSDTDVSALEADLEPFRIELHREHEAVRVEPIGEIDMATAGILDAQLRAQAGSPRVVLDLRRVTFMDSTGLKLILTWNTRAREDGIELSLMPGPPGVQRLFEVSGALGHLTFRR